MWDNTVKNTLGFGKGKMGHHTLPLGGYDDDDYDTPSSRSSEPQKVEVNLAGIDVIIMREVNTAVDSKMDELKAYIDKQIDEKVDAKLKAIENRKKLEENIRNSGIYKAVEPLSNLLRDLGPDLPRVIEELQTKDFHK